MTAVVEPLPCRRTNETADEIVITYGAQWLVTVYNTDTGDLLAIYTYCEWPGEDHRSRLRCRNRRRVRRRPREILALEVGINPPVDGIGGVTQLDTWFWCDDPGIVDVEARTTGSVASAAVGISELVWTITGPSGTETRTATTCGIEPDPEGNGDGAAAAASGPRRARATTSSPSARRGTAPGRHRSGSTATAGSPPGRSRSPRSPSPANRSPTLSSRSKPSAAARNGVG
ncbi:MAG: hypothetical protein R2697_18760 [Ilumatobacteraceae bacterium]